MIRTCFARVWFFLIYIGVVHEEIEESMMRFNLTGRR